MKPLYISDYADASPDDLATIPWGMFTQARQECFMALAPTYYTYGSGRGVRTYSAIPYSPWVDTIRQRLNTAPMMFEGVERGNFNVGFLNRYENASQHLGWHADDSPGMNHAHPIAVVSFGQAREIWWKPQNQSGPVPADQRQLLEHGSLFIMPAGFQRTHFHRIPKGDRKMKPRVSLTFRHYVPGLKIEGCKEGLKEISAGVDAADGRHADT